MTNLVEPWFFGGLSINEAAAILNISRATTERWWAYSRAFLYSETQDDG